MVVGLSQLASVAAQGNEGGGPLSGLHVPNLTAEPIFKLGPIYITNTMALAVVVMAILVIIGYLLGRNAKIIPNRKQSLIEWILEAMLGIVEQSAGTNVGRKIFPLIATIFIYIIFASWTEIIPGVDTIHVTSPVSHEQVSLLRAPTSDINMTLAMAALTLVIVQIAGIAAHGLWGHFKQFLNPFHIIDEFARIISLTVRLFANIFGGEVLLAVIFAFSSLFALAILPVVVPIIFMIWELFVGLLQALVFALLGLAYITLAVTGHGAGEQEEEERRPATA